MKRGETLGLVGESGCGKSTVGRLMIRLLDPTSGSIKFEGRDIATAEGAELKALRREMQIIFQDPFSSLDPRTPIGDSIGEGLLIHGVKDARQRQNQVLEIMHKVGLEDYHYKRYPHEFSGGQRQRIGIARALVLRPKFIVCDEPVSALDVSIQSQVLESAEAIAARIWLDVYFHRAQHERGGAHQRSGGGDVSGQDGGDHRARRVVSQSAASVHAGAAVRDSGAHAKVKRERIILKGDVPSPLNPPSGCRFHPRCPVAIDVCSKARTAVDRSGRRALVRVSSQTAGGGGGCSHSAG